MTEKSSIVYIEALGEILLAVGIIFGPLIGYVAQYNLVKSTKSLGSFSIDVCAILIFANILRIYFWFGKFYETPLLLQSILMVVMQFILLYQCLQVANIDVYKDQDKTFFTQPIAAFWRWNSLSSYIISVGFLTIAVGVVSLLLSNIVIYWEFLGFLSCAIEASLGLPQALQNQRQKSTKGVSQTMINSWLVGDLFKTFYYLSKQAPMQFVFCGLTQLAIDFWIIAQVVMMGGTQKTLEL